MLCVINSLEMLKKGRTQYDNKYEVEEEVFTNNEMYEIHLLTTFSPRYRANQTFFRIFQT